MTNKTGRELYNALKTRYPTKIEVNDSYYACMNAKFCALRRINRKLHKTIIPNNTIRPRFGFAFEPPK